jgi:uncharacterized membrane protein
MDLGDRMRRWAGWMCLGMVATLTSMGYHFGNIRFAPLVAGFAILAAVCLLERGRTPMRSDGIHPRRDSGINPASG